jgi:hypothetical protein
MSQDQYGDAQQRSLYREAMDGLGEDGFCLPFEQTRQKRVSYHAQEQTDYRPNETATYPRFGNSDDVVGGKSKEGAAIKAKTNKDGSNQRREGENNAAHLLAEGAAGPEGIDRK